MNSDLTDISRRTFVERFAKAVFGVRLLPSFSGLRAAESKLGDKAKSVILPAHTPGNAFYEDIQKTNAALDPLKLDSDAKVKLLDLWSDFTNADGTIKKDLFTPDNIHLSPAGYAVYAEKLKPLLVVE
jgi:lysophospholipase L1-like esterase